MAFFQMQLQSLLFQRGVDGSAAAVHPTRSLLSSPFVVTRRCSPHKNTPAWEGWSSHGELSSDRCMTTGGVDGSLRSPSTPPVVHHVPCYFNASLGTSKIISYRRRPLPPSLPPSPPPADASRRLQIIRPVSARFSLATHIAMRSHAAPPHRRAARLVARPAIDADGVVHRRHPPHHAHTPASSEENQHDSPDHPGHAQRKHSPLHTLKSGGGGGVYVMGDYYVMGEYASRGGGRLAWSLNSMRVTLPGGGSRRPMATTTTTTTTTMAEGVGIDGCQCHPRSVVVHPHDNPSRGEQRRVASLPVVLPTPVRTVNPRNS